MGKAKKSVLKLLPPDWREAMFDHASQPCWLQSRPKLLPALSVLWLTGCRPAELESGVQIAYLRDGLAIEVKGAKCSDDKQTKRGQPVRRYLFKTPVTEKPHPALAVLLSMAVQDVAANGIGHATVSHNADYLYNSIVTLGKATFPKLRTRVSPYCFRHQAASDLKADPTVSLEDAAQFMGHLSDYSIGKYGRAVHGKRGGARVKPVMVKTSRPVKHSPKVDKLARFKIASVNRRKKLTQS
ncbi:site-specific integrase [Ralstonia pseudosolanacearum]|uniref:site-specific integrase n=1 Tax=Ralstonia pseudosolanacearum TaxID=1310165 RepID=UPI001FF9822C|nr:site-specific integrase [Ralstonia pseudosolanacearum]